MKPRNIVPRIVILVVYKINKGQWRGFCSPYDISCNGSTQKEVNDTLQELVSLYEEGLKKYKYPSHLSIKPLTDAQDQKILTKALEFIAEREKEKLVNDYYEYQEHEFDHKFNIKNTDNSFSGEYYHQPLHAS